MNYFPQKVRQVLKDMQAAYEAAMGELKRATLGETIAQVLKGMAIVSLVAYAIRTIKAALTQ